MSGRLNSTASSSPTASPATQTSLPDTNTHQNAGMASTTGDTQSRPSPPAHRAAPGAPDGRPSQSCNRPNIRGDPNKNNSGARKSPEANPSARQKSQSRLPARNSGQKSRNPSGPPAAIGGRHPPRPGPSLSNQTGPHKAAAAAPSGDSRASVGQSAGTSNTRCT